MRLLGLLESIDIFEAAIDRYWPMLKGIAEAVAPFSKWRAESMRTVVKDAVRILRKDDRIIWFLRYYKIWALSEAIHSVSQHINKPTQGEAARELLSRLQDAYQKEINKLKAKSGHHESTIENAAQAVANPAFLQNMEHFLSLDIPNIQNSVFGWETPSAILNVFEETERQWAEKRKSMIPIDRGNTETIIKFEDGSEWINLHQNYCDTEAQAMGHCGNKASYKMTDTILSYRTIETDPETEEQMWMPRLTFVLNTENGMLGEMKGRRNQKPDKKYHPVIVALLRHPIVRGIVGGGYNPANNFRLTDLPKEQAEALAAEKPGLATLDLQYDLEGMTNDLFNRIQTVLREHGFPEIEEYDPEEDEIVLDTNLTMEKLFETYGTGYDTTPHLDPEYLHNRYVDVFRELPSEDLWRLNQYTKDNYDISEWEEETGEQYNPSETQDIANVLASNSDSFWETAKEAIQDWISNSIEAEAEFLIDVASEDSLIDFRQDPEDMLWSARVDTNNFIGVVIPKIQSGEARYRTDWGAVLEADLLDPTERFLEWLGTSEEEWDNGISIAARTLMESEEMQKLRQEYPTPEEAGQMRLPLESRKVFSR